MKSECQTVSPVERNLQVSIEGEKIVDEINRAYRKLGQQVKIKGFRQGKVPRQVLERYYKGEVESDVLSRLIGQHYSDALDEHELHPVDQPELKNGEFIPGQDFHFSAKVEVRPDIEFKSYKGLSAERVTREVSQEDLDAELEKIRAHYSKVVPVEDRDVVEKDDLVVANFQATVDGEKFKGGSGTGYVMDTGQPNFLPEVIEELIGKKVEEKFGVEVTLPDDFQNEEVAGKKALFVVTVVQIKVKELPVLDDELAKDVGDFEDLNALTTKVKQELVSKYADEDEEKFKSNVVDALIEKNPFEIPPTLVERQVDVMISQSVGQVSPEQLQAMGIDLTKIREEMRPKAEWRVRRGMLLEGIAKEEKIEVDKKAVEDRINEVAEKIGQPASRLRGLYKGERREELVFSIRLERALDIVINNLVGAENSGSEETAAPEAEAGTPEEESKE